MTQNKTINEQIEELKKEEKRILEMKNFYLYCENKLISKKFLTDKENKRFKQLKNWVESGESRVDLKVCQAKLSTLQESQKMFLEEIDKLQSDTYYSCNCGNYDEGCINCFRIKLKSKIGGLGK